MLYVIYHSYTGAIILISKEKMSYLKQYHLYVMNGMLENLISGGFVS